MKRSQKNAMLPWLAPVLGGLGLIAMWFVYATGTDSQGLLDPLHSGAIAVWVLAAAMIGALLFLLRGMEDTAGFRRLFPDSRLAAVGTLAAAIGILATAAESLTALEEPVRMLSGLLKVAAGIALMYLAWCRWKNVRGSFLAWATAAVYMLLRILFEYRTWSTEPELLRYCFPLLASVCMVLAAYHRTAFAVKLGSRKQYIFFTQMGAFFCLLSLPGTPEPFYAGMAVWALTDRCSLKNLKKKKEAPPEDTP